MSFVRKYSPTVFPIYVQRDHRESHVSETPFSQMRFAVKHRTVDLRKTCYAPINVLRSEYVKLNITYT
jgi:hypothetical protein